MKVHQKDKGRSRGGRGDTFTSQQLQKVHDEFDDEATLCVFRLKSLKQGQSRSLLTQVARHHAAQVCYFLSLFSYYNPYHQENINVIYEFFLSCIQLNFFRKGFKSLEALEPHVRQITEEQHIDYLVDEDEDDEDDEDDDNDIEEESVEADYGHRDRNNEELSFNYRRQNLSPHSPSNLAEVTHI